MDTALLLPALSSVSSRAEMLPLSTCLGTAFECVVADWPGFGDAPRAGRDGLHPETLDGFLDELIGHAAAPFALGVGAGHAAPYLVRAALRHAGCFTRLVLIAPTWRGPLPTMLGASRLTFAARRAFEAPGLGPLLFHAATGRRMLERMLRGHVYADPATVTPALLAAKLAIVRQPGARFATAAFISGGLDPVASRAAFLALFDAGLPPTLLLRPRGAPRKSAAEMAALAATGRVMCVGIPGALAAHEEHAPAVAAAIADWLAV